MTILTAIPFILRAIAIASMGGILFGYDMGVISGALPQVTTEFDLSKSQQEMIVSFFYIGCCIGAALGGILCDTGGRKTAILFTDIMFVLGAAILVFSRSLELLLLGRIVMGFAVSVSGVADVSYLHEISPDAWRGSVVSVNEACISLGFLLAYVAGYFFGRGLPTNGWRWMFGVSAIVAVLQFVGMTLMPESPVWLRNRGKLEEAELALITIHDGRSRTEQAAEQPKEQKLTDVPTTTSPLSSNLYNNGTPADDSKVITTSYASMEDVEKPFPSSTDTTPTSSSKTIVQTSSNPESKLSNSQPPIGSFLSQIKEYHRQSIIAALLSILQQFCGHTNILNYAPEIFQQLGMKSTLGCTLFIGVVKFIVTCTVIWKIEYLGRRFLLLFGMGLISTSLVVFVISFDENHQGNNDGTDHDVFASLRTYLSVICVFGVVFGYAASFGPLTWLMTSEMFPTSIRGRALGVATILTYASAYLVSYTLLSVQDMFGATVPFVAYAIITIGGLVFAVLAIPDTGSGKSPEEIDDEMSTMWWWRQQQQQCSNNRPNEKFYEDATMT